MKPQRKRVRGGRRTPPRASKRQAFQDLVNVGVGGFNICVERLYIVAGLDWVGIGLKW